MKKMKTMLAVLLALAMVFSLSLTAFAEDDVGSSEENPEIVENNGFGFEMGHYFEAGGIYWFSFAADAAGLVVLNIDIYDADINDVYVTAGNLYSYAFVDINGQKSCAPFTVWEGDNVVIGIDAPAGADVFVSAVINPYDEYLPVPGFLAEINDYTFYAYVEAGTPINFTTPMMMGSANWAGKGVKIEGVVENPMLGGNPVDRTVVTVDGVEYTDLMGDGDIQFTLTGFSDMFAITFDGYGSGVYKITVVDEVLSECDHAAMSDVAAVPAGCHTPGNIAHKKCDGCGTLFAADGVTSLSEYDVIENPENYLEYVDRTVTCTEPGNITHYHCNGCGKNYDDYEGSVELDSIASPALGHNMGEGLIAETDSTCCEQGHYGYYFCSNCYGYFKDEAGSEAYADYDAILKPADPEAHIWVLVEAEGNVPAAHVSTKLTYLCDCSSCWMINFADYTAELDTPPTCGELEHHDATETTKEYWSCPNCGKLFSDAEGENEVSADDLLIGDSDGTGDPISIVLGLTMLSGGAVLTLGKKKF